jgi:hypothetical protein
MREHAMETERNAGPAGEIAQHDGDDDALPRERRRDEREKRSEMKDQQADARAPAVGRDADGRAYHVSRISTGYRLAANAPVF